MQWYLKVVRDNYANFAGRARRKEYWMFVLFNTIFVIVAMIADNIAGTTFELMEGYNLPYGWIYVLYALAILIPALAVSIRRLHDVGKSGWWIFLALLPIVGGIWLLVLACTEGNPAENVYGPSPKAAA